MPARNLSNSPIKWLILATPLVASVSLPGFFLAYSTSSATEFTASFGLASSMLVATASVLTGANTAAHWYGGFCMVIGPSMIGPFEPTNSVCPSGAERAT